MSTAVLRTTNRKLAALAAVAILLLSLVAVRAWLREEPSVLPNATPPQKAVPLVDTNYPIPANAWFVSPTGSDTNAGTLSAPFATISKAVGKAANGDTIVLRAGTYREAVGSVFERLTFQPYPHEKVWLKGSIVLTSFAPSGANWVSSFNDTLCQNCYASTAIDPLYPNAGLPEQLFIDGEPVAQVAAANQVGPGTFYVDVTNQRLIMGDNPSGHVVEASTLPQAIQFNTSGAAGSVFRGIGVAQYASYYNNTVAPGSIVVASPNVTIENVTAAQSASRGLAIVSTGATVRGSKILFNGFAGMLANGANGLLLEGNTLQFNNLEHFTTAPSAGSGQQCAAAKITATDGAIVRDNIASDNWCNGIWFDVSSNNITAYRNLIQRNSRHGLPVEISANAAVFSNVITDNGGLGIKISGTPNVRVWNNTVANNLDAQVGVYEDARTNSNSAQVAAGITWDTKNINFANNILSSDAPTTYPTLHVLDTNNPKQYSAGAMVNLMDHDAWTRSSSGTPTFLTNWPDAAGKASNANSFTALKTVSGKEVGGQGVDASISPYFTNPAGGDYSLVAGSAADKAGATLPSDIAALLGVSAASPDLGAIVWPGAPATKDQRPTAAIAAPSCTSVTCTLDGRGSTDPDGTVASYQWDFGDGTTATGSQVSHTFPRTGSYTVGLTVADNRGAQAQSSRVVSVVGPNIAPTAAMAASCVNNTCTFDGRGSSDSDGSVQAWAWDFGDGSTGSGATAAHTYSVAGTWTATLTVTDDRSGTDTASGTATPAPAATPNVYGADGFGRTASKGWGTADTGGAWSSLSGAANLSVANGAGVMALPTPGSGASVLLPSVATSQSDIVFTLSSDKPATGTGILMTAMGRRVGTNLEYRGRVRVDATGAVFVLLQKLAGSTTVTNLTTETKVAGLSYVPGTGVRVRLKVLGLNPTTVSIKTWTAGTAEPASWNLTATDSTPALQATGTVGLLGFVTSNATNAPISLRVDSLSVKPVNFAPVASAAVSCVSQLCSADASASTDPEGTAMTFAWSFGDNTTATGVKPAHTYSKSGTYTVTLTVTDAGGVQTVKRVTVNV